MNTESERCLFCGSRDTESYWASDTEEWITRCRDCRAGSATPREDNSTTGPRNGKKARRT